MGRPETKRWVSPATFILLWALLMLEERASAFSMAPLSSGFSTGSLRDVMQPWEFDDIDVRDTQDDFSDNYSDALLDETVFSKYVSKDNVKNADQAHSRFLSKTFPMEDDISYSLTPPQKSRLDFHHTPKPHSRTEGHSSAKSSLIDESTHNSRIRLGIPKPSQTLRLRDGHSEESSTSIKKTPTFPRSSSSFRMNYPKFPIPYVTDSGLMKYTRKQQNNNDDMSVVDLAQRLLNKESRRQRRNRSKRDTAGGSEVKEGSIRDALDTAAEITLDQTATPETKSNTTASAGMRESVITDGIQVTDTNVRDGSNPRPPPASDPLQVIRRLTLLLERMLRELSVFGQKFTLRLIRMTERDDINQMQDIMKDFDISPEKPIFFIAGGLRTLHRSNMSLVEDSLTETLTNSTLNTNTTLPVNETTVQPVSVSQLPVFNATTEVPQVPADVVNTTIYPILKPVNVPQAPAGVDNTTIFPILKPISVTSSPVEADVPPEDELEVTSTALPEIDPDSDIVENSNEQTVSADDIVNASSSSKDILVATRRKRSIPEFDEFIVLPGRSARTENPYDEDDEEAEFVQLFMGDGESTGLNGRISQHDESLISPNLQNRNIDSSSVLNYGVPRVIDQSQAIVGKDLGNPSTGVGHANEVGQTSFSLPKMIATGTVTKIAISHTPRDSSSTGNVTEGNDHLRHNELSPSSEVNHEAEIPVAGQNIPSHEQHLLADKQVVPESISPSGLSPTLPTTNIVKDSSTGISLSSSEAQNTTQNTTKTTKPVIHSVFLERVNNLASNVYQTISSSPLLGSVIERRKVVSPAHPTITFFGERSLQATDMGFEKQTSVQKSTLELEKERGAQKLLNSDSQRDASINRIASNIEAVEIVSPTHPLPAESLVDTDIARETLQPESTPEKESTRAAATTLLEDITVPNDNIGIVPHRVDVISQPQPGNHESGHVEETKVESNPSLLNTLSTEVNSHVLPTGIKESLPTAQNTLQSLDNQATSANPVLRENEMALESKEVPTNVNTLSVLNANTPAIPPPEAEVVTQPILNGESSVGRNVSRNKPEILHEKNQTYVNTAGNNEAAADAVTNKVVETPSKIAIPEPSATGESTVVTGTPTSLPLETDKIQSSQREASTPGVVPVSLEQDVPAETFQKKETNKLVELETASHSEKPKDIKVQNLDHLKTSVDERIVAAAPATGEVKNPTNNEVSLKSPEAQVEPLSEAVVEDKTIPLSVPSLLVESSNVNKASSQPEIAAPLGGSTGIVQQSTGDPLTQSDVSVSPIDKPIDEHVAVEEKTTLMKNISDSVPVSVVDLEKVVRNAPKVEQIAAETVPDKMSPAPEIKTDNDVPGTVPISVTETDSAAPLKTVAETIPVPVGVVENNDSTTPLHHHLPPSPTAGEVVNKVASVDDQTAPTENREQSHPLDILDSDVAKPVVVEIRAPESLTANVPETNKLTASNLNETEHLNVSNADVPIKNSQNTDAPSPALPSVAVVEATPTNEKTVLTSSEKLPLEDHKDMTAPVPPEPSLVTDAVLKNVIETPAPVSADPVLSNSPNADVVKQTLSPEINHSPLTVPNVDSAPAKTATIKEAEVTLPSPILSNTPVVSSNPIVPTSVTPVLSVSHVSSSLPVKVATPVSGLNAPLQEVVRPDYTGYVSQGVDDSVLFLPAQAPVIVTSPPVFSGYSPSAILRKQQQMIKNYFSNYFFRQEETI